MNCYAWQIPEGCYAAALGQGEACPSANWFWIAAVVAAGLVLLSGGKKAPATRAARAPRTARRRA